MFSAIPAVSQRCKHCQVRMEAERVDLLEFSSPILSFFPYLLKADIVVSNTVKMTQGIN
jgi:hypothetical protein